jgi:hypothetical protein
MIDVMFWRRRRPWWQRLGVGFELKVPSLQAPELEPPRIRPPWASGSYFERPQLPAPHFWARWPWERMEMPRLHAPDVAMPWSRSPALEMPSLEAPRFGGWGAGWFRRSQMPEVPPSPSFDFGRWWPYLAAAALVGGLLVFFLDPQGGRRRRAMARDRLSAQFRHTGRRLARTGRGVGGWSYGVTQRATHRRFASEPADDVALVDRVKSELFRHDVPREHLSINAAEGVVELRGQVEDAAEIGRLEMLVRRVPGVHDVHNYLHTPGTPAPNKSDALSSFR